MKHSRLVWAAVIGLMLPPALPIEAAPASERYRRMQEDLRRARSSLHEAHRELARKTERIAELERLLEDKDARSPGPEERKGKSEAQNLSSNEKKRGKNRGPEQASQPGKAMARARGKEENEKEQKESRLRLEMSFATRSAVNYEDWARALEAIQGRLEEQPQARFRIEGGADDLAYDTANEEVAGNRVRFFLSHLASNGVDPNRFEVGALRSTRGKKGTTRFVKITEIVSETGNLSVRND